MGKKVYIELDEPKSCLECFCFDRGKACCKLNGKSLIDDPKSDLSKKYINHKLISCPMISDYHELIDRIILNNK